MYNLTRAREHGLAAAHMRGPRRRAMAGTRHISRLAAAFLVASALGACAFVGSAYSQSRTTNDTAVAERIAAVEKAKKELSEATAAAIKIAERNLATAEANLKVYRGLNPRLIEVWEKKYPDVDLKTCSFALVREIQLDVRRATLLDSMAEQSNLSALLEQDLPEATKKVLRERLAFSEVSYRHRAFEEEARQLKEGRFEGTMAAHVENSRDPSLYQAWSDAAETDKLFWYQWRARQLDARVAMTRDKPRSKAHLAAVAEQKAFYETNVGKIWGSYGDADLGAMSSAFRSAVLGAQEEAERKDEQNAR
jgi:hypothetical protein